MRLRDDPADQAAWQRVDDLYRPLIRRWLLRDPGLQGDLDDVVQDVMTFLIRELPGFQRRRNGSFRCWLREITVRRLQAYCRQRTRQPRGQGGPREGSPLHDLSDPSSRLSRLWDEEHNRYVLHRLLALIEPQFEDRSLTAFRRLVFDGVSPAQVAEELNSTVGAVLVAKSRVLRRLREEAAEFLD
jgi:RNA polymerase sigma-70 factor (ECF subfamily)